MWKRFAAVGMAAIMILALIWVALPRTLSAQQVLARAAKSTAVEAGQIVYQVYTSGGNLYREWQRLEVAPDGASVPVESMTLRYAKDDTAFKTPLEAVYSAPTRLCRMPADGAAVDALGCQTVAPEVAAPVESDAGSAGPGYVETIDTATRERIQQALREAPDAPEAASLPLVESIPEQIEHLQSSANTVNVVQAQFAERPVYAITESPENTRPDEDAFTRTLYVDQESFLPVGVTYTSGSGSDDASATWNILVLEFRILDAGTLDFDPFAWPPANLPVAAPPAP